MTGSGMNSFTLMKIFHGIYHLHELTVFICFCIYVHALSKFFLIISWLKQNLQASNILLNMEYECLYSQRSHLGSGLIFAFSHGTP